MLQKQGNIPQRDMFNTYNMGVGMTVIVARMTRTRLWPPCMPKAVTPTHR
jgi:phosphoribosylaminoimidazole (AIR) synthetase